MNWITGIALFVSRSPFELQFSLHLQLCKWNEQGCQLRLRPIRSLDFFDASLALERIETDNKVTTLAYVVEISLDLFVYSFDEFYVYKNSFIFDRSRREESCIQLTFRTAVMWHAFDVFGFYLAFD